MRSEGIACGDFSLSKNTQITGERCSPLHTNSVFSPFVGDGALDVPLVSDFFNKLVSPAAIFFGAKSLRSLRGYIYIKG